MPKSKTMNDPSPEPSPAADSFATQPGGDAFSVPSEEQSTVLWAELRELLSGLVDKPATAVDREAADNIVRRIGLDPVVCPLLLTCYRESVELQQTIDQGKGQAEKAAAALKECRIYVNVVASTTPEEARRIQAERQRLEAEHTAASILAESAARASSGLSHLHNWLPELFGLPNPWKERDELGRPKKCGGLLSTSICPTKTAEAATTLGVDPYLPNSWQTLRRPEPTPPRRRFRTSAINPQSGVSALGQSPYSRF